MAPQAGSPRLDSISLPIPAQRPRTAPPVAPAGPAAVGDSRPSPFVRWAALQRAASDSVNGQNASLDPVASGRAAGSSRATDDGAADSQLAATPVTSAVGGSSRASSVRLSPTMQGLLAPRPELPRSASAAAAPEGMPTASLAAAFQAVATPRPPGDSILSASTPPGSAYSRQAYAEQPTVWSSPGTASSPGSPLDTLPDCPASQPMMQGLGSQPPPSLRHSGSDIWEAGRSLLPRARRTATADDAGSSLSEGVLARLPSQPRSVVPEAIAASGGLGHGKAAVATIPEASPVPTPPQPAALPERSPLRLSSLRAPSHERVALPGGPAVRLDAARISVMGRAIAATAANGQGPAGAGEVLGGELHVRIISGSNVLDALVHRQRTLTSESRKLKVGCNSHVSGAVAVGLVHISTYVQ